LFDADIKQAQHENLEVTVKAKYGQNVEAIQEVTIEEKQEPSSVGDIH